MQNSGLGRFGATFNPYMPQSYQPRTFAPQGLGSLLTPPSGLQAAYGNVSQPQPIMLGGGGPGADGSGGGSGIGGMAPNDASDQGNAIGNNVGMNVSPNVASTAAGLAFGPIGSTAAMGLAHGINAMGGLPGGAATAPTGNTTAAAMGQMDAQAQENDAIAAAIGGGGGDASGSSSVGVGAAPGTPGGIGGIGGIGSEGTDGGGGGGGGGK
jgi:hypothetical protein